MSEAMELCSVESSLAGRGKVSPMHCVPQPDSYSNSGLGSGLEFSDSRTPEASDPADPHGRPDVQPSSVDRAHITDGIAGDQALLRAYNMDCAAAIASTSGADSPCPRAAARSVYMSLAASLAGRKHAREEERRHADVSGCAQPRRMSFEGERGVKRLAMRLAPSSQAELEGMEGVDVQADGPLDEYRFNMYMRDLLAEKSKDILCCKGVLYMQGYGSTKFVFKGAHEAICYGPAEQDWRPEERRVSHVVFIGRGLDREALSEGLRSCRWIAPPPGWDKIRDDNTKLSFYVNQKTGEKTWVRPENAA